MAAVHRRSTPKEQPRRPGGCCHRGESHAAVRARVGGGEPRQAAGNGEEDGILTAEEIAAMDLNGVEWAVLSACDTGIGPVRAGEGVFGLRRAFQVAGVRTLIMSLWEVEDQSARRWMTTLYDARFVKGLNTAQPSSASVRS